MKLSESERNEIIENINKLDQFGKQQISKYIKNKYPDTSWNKDTKTKIFFSVNDTILHEISDIVKGMIQRQDNMYYKLTKEMEDIKKEFDENTYKKSNKKIETLEIFLQRDIISYILPVAKILQKRNKKFRIPDEKKRRRKKKDYPNTCEGRLLTNIRRINKKKENELEKLEILEKPKKKYKNDDNDDDINNNIDDNEIDNEIDIELDDDDDDILEDNNDNNEDIDKNDNLEEDVNNDEEIDEENENDIDIDKNIESESEIEDKFNTYSFNNESETDTETDTESETESEIETKTKRRKNENNERKVIKERYNKININKIQKKIKK